MEIIIFSLCSAFGILLVLCRTIGFRRTLRWRKVIDVITTFGLPTLFMGTFNGMMVAFFTGLWVTVITSLLFVLANPHEAVAKLSHAEDSHTKNASGNRPPRSRRSKLCPQKICV